jgi:hypothetical protein
MNHDIYQMKQHPVTDRVLEEMRQNIADGRVMGVTLQGNRLTVRWGESLKQVHMVIIEVEDGDPDPHDQLHEGVHQFCDECDQHRKAVGVLRKKHGLSLRDAHEAVKALRAGDAQLDNWLAEAEGVRR